MPRFAKAPEDDYPIVYLADTDKPLPRNVNPHTRYAYFKLIARGGPVDHPGVQGSPPDARGLLQEPEGGVCGRSR